MDRQYYEFGPFVLDLKRKLLVKNGRTLQPGQRGMALLEAMLVAEGKPVSKTDLMDAAWPGVSVEESNLSVQIAALRKLLGTSPEGGEWINTVQRLGYQLVLPTAPAPPTPPRPLVMDTSPGRAEDGKPSIAVLPFDNMSPDPAHSFFADGITDEITTALSRLKSFFVIARNTMFTYKGKPVNIRGLGEELGVHYILEGSVRSAGGHIRVSAQLIDAASGSHIWGDRYERAADDIFAIQDEITTSVIARIGSEVLAAENARAVRKATDNLSAWECLVRGMFLSARMSKDDSHAALDLLRQAIAHDPGYAQALGLMAWVMVWRAAQGWDDMQVVLPEADAASQRALAADDNEPWAWLGQAAVGIATRNSALSVSSMERAVELNPNFAMGQGMLGLVLSFSGRYADALTHLEQAVRLSPRELFQGAFAQQYAFAHFAGADYSRGLEFAMRAHQLRPGHVYPMVIALACAGHLGSQTATAQIIRDLKAAIPHATANWFETTTPYVLAEDRQRLATGLRLAGLD